MKQRIAIFCIFKNNESSLQKLLSHFEDCELLPDVELLYFFYENDSQDSTKMILESFLRGRNGKVLSEDVNKKSYGSSTSAERMTFMCYARNKCKSLADGFDFDYALLVDSDIEFGAENLKRSIDLLNTHQRISMVTPNVRQDIPDLTFYCVSDGSYYDVFPLRDKHGRAGLYFSDCPLILEEDRVKWYTGDPVDVMAAFGGFALIRWEIFNSVWWSADIACDHVNMCYDIIRLGGRIVIDPQNIVRTYVHKDRVNLHDFAEKGRAQLDYYKRVNSTNIASRSVIWQTQ